MQSPQRLGSVARSAQKPEQQAGVVPEQVVQAVPKPLVPQTAVPDSAVQVPLRQQPLGQAVASQVGLVQVPPQDVCRQVIAPTRL